MTARSMVSIVPCRKAASDGSRTVFTEALTFAIRAAFSIRLASPMTTGRQNPYTSGRSSALATTSGPMPAASPMVIPMMGPLMSVAPGFERRAAALQRRTIPERSCFGDQREQAGRVGETEGNARFHLPHEVDAARAEGGKDGAGDVSPGRDESAQLLEDRRHEAPERGGNRRCVARVDVLAEGGEDDRVAPRLEGTVHVRAGARARRGPGEKRLGVDVEAVDSGLAAKLTRLFARNLRAASDQDEDAPFARLESRPSPVLGTEPESGGKMARKSAGAHPDDPAGQLRARFRDTAQVVVRL